MAERWKVFGWKVLEVNGHNHDELRNVFDGEVIPFEHSSTWMDVSVINPVTSGKRSTISINNAQILYQFVERFCPETSCGKVWK